ncbi:universal stress protein [Streptomyces sp. NPDC059785]|uniref:universal stress protein n=1 Tax=Streptomyces sp. NPDC059785 TaxID=3346945 RepID=UPI0036564F8E
MLPPVAVGVDGSAESLAAAGWAAREAVRRGTRLRLVQVTDRTARGRRDESAGAAGRRVLREAEAHVRAGCQDVRVEAEQAAGPVTGTLLEAAGQAGLLVLGSRGLSGFTGFRVGSVALGVVSRAVRPVVLVRAGETPEDEHLPAADGSGSVRTRHRDVVLALDVGDPCDEVVDFAFETARLRHARLRVVHAWRAPGPLGLGAGDIGLVDGPRQAGEWLGFLEAVLEVWREKYPDVEVAPTVVADRPATAVARAASGAGLLVVGRRRPEDPHSPRLGLVTHAAVRHADCPVAVVPHG